MDIQGKHTCDIRNIDSRHWLIPTTMLNLLVCIVPIYYIEYIWCLIRNINTVTNYYTFCTTPPFCTTSPIVTATHIKSMWVAVTMGLVISAPFIPKNANASKWEVFEISDGTLYYSYCNVKVHGLLGITTCTFMVRSVV